MKNTYSCSWPMGGHGPPYPKLPKSLTPCRVVFASCGLSPKDSSRERFPDGMLKIDQCLNIRRGASGSSRIITSARVPVGGSDHRRGGDELAPSQVNFTGIGSPSPNAGEENSIVPSAERWGSNGSDSGSSPPHAVAMSAVSISADRRMATRASVRASGRCVLPELIEFKFASQKLLSGCIRRDFRPDGAGTGSIVFIICSPVRQYR
jgi:hypothetical protein